MCASKASNCQQATPMEGQFEMVHISKRNITVEDKKWGEHNTEWFKSAEDAWNNLNKW